MGSSPLPHIAIFPFFSKGHTIPLLHLARLIHCRRLATLTFFTTPRNASFIRCSLADIEPNIIELPFPENIPDVPAGVESTDQLPSISLFLPFVIATKLLKPHFERALSTLKPTVSFLISDGFLGWTNESASVFGIPRLVFYGMGNFAMTVSAAVAAGRPHAGLTSYDQPFTVPGFPALELTRADLNPPFDDADPQGPLHEFTTEQVKATICSQGIVVNSFYELEASYLDYWNKSVGPRAWCVGPVCVAKPKAEPAGTELTAWLDSQAAVNRPVLYVAFGSQADVSAEQLQEIALGLEQSGLYFLWVVRAKGPELCEGFEERTRDRGRVVRKWVDQLEILRHESIKGFMSHCGWNSVMESVFAGVPILAWPMIAEQHLNAKFVVDELGIGIRVRASDGTKYGLVKCEDIARLVKELLVGEKGKTAAKKVEHFAVAAEKAVADGGSSATMLEQMIDEVSQKSSEMQMSTN